jgi:hypothetical protein
MEEKRILVVLADTADRPIHAERAVYERTFERVAEYYREVSNEQVRIVSTVIGPIQMPLQFDFYLQGPVRAERIPGNAESLAQDAVVGAIERVDVTAYVALRAIPLPSDFMKVRIEVEPPRRKRRAV